MQIQTQMQMQQAERGARANLEMSDRRGEQANRQSRGSEAKSIYIFRQHSLGGPEGRAGARR